MADGSAQKNIFCIHKGNRNQKLLARRMSFAISHQELARCGSTSACNLTSFSQIIEREISAACLLRRDAGGVMKQRRVSMAVAACHLRRRYPAENVEVELTGGMN
jgi:hypothetical protein